MNNKLEEYKELCQSIRLLLANQQNIKNFVYVITLGVFGATNIFNELYFITLISAILISLLWINELRRIKAVFRLATYIEVFIETEIRDLTYETLSRKNRFSTSFFSKMLRLISNVDIPVLFLLHAIYGCIICYKENKFITIISILILTFLFLILGISSFFIALKGEMVEKRNWLKVQHSINEETQMVTKTKLKLKKNQKK